MTETDDTIKPHHFVPGPITTSMCAVCGTPERGHEKWTPPDVSGVVERLREAIATSRNDELSAPNSRRRERFVFRIEAMEEAANLLLSLASERDRLIHDNTRLVAASSELATDNKALREALKLAAHRLAWLQVNNTVPNSREWFEIQGWTEEARSAFISKASR